MIIPFVRPPLHQIRLVYNQNTFMKRKSIDYIHLPFHAPLACSNAGSLSNPSEVGGSRPTKRHYRWHRHVTHPVWRWKGAVLIITHWKTLQLATLRL